MGLLKRLFAGDPRRDLERAEALLASGEGERALKLARRAQERAQPADKNRGQALVEKAHQALATEAIEKASVAEKAEYFEDAAEWLGVALDHVDDDARRDQLKALRGTLLERADEAEDEAWEPTDAEPESPAGSDSQTALDFGVHYQALIDMLTEDFAERYQARPPAFRAAYVAFNEGQTAVAHEAFEALGALSGEDPVVRFERGRSRMAHGDLEGAVTDFETAWQAFGAEPLDLTGELSVPALWADAMLALSKPDPVIERLAELTDPIAAAPLSERYAQALLMTQRFEEARDFLASTLVGNSGRDIFAYLLAEALKNLGERPAAIDCLETAITPSCTTGCAPRAKFLPSFRALVSLYLEDESHHERVRELMTLVAQTLGGRLTHRDHSLLAGYYEQVGDAKAAEQARGHAQRLSEEATAGDVAEAVPEPPPAAGRMRAPL